MAVGNAEVTTISKEWQYPRLCCFDYPSLGWTMLWTASPDDTSISSNEWTGLIDHLLELASQLACPTELFRDYKVKDVWVKSRNNPVRLEIFGC